MHWRPSQAHAFTIRWNILPPLWFGLHPIFASHRITKMINWQAWKFACTESVEYLNIRSWLQTLYTTRTGRWWRGSIWSSMRRLERVWNPRAMFWKLIKLALCVNSLFKTWTIRQSGPPSKAGYHTNDYHGPASFMVNLLVSVTREKMVHLQVFDQFSSNIDRKSVRVQPCVDI